MQFRNKIGRDVFNHKYRYREGGCGTWSELSNTLVHRICDKYMFKKDIEQLVKYVEDMKFIPGGRYLYYAGRPAKFINNCFVFIAEDSREGWADLGHKHFMALMCGGGCGTYYGKVRPRGRSISRTGGESSGPIPLMKSMNEIGRHVKQGGSRRCLPIGTKVTMSDYNLKNIEDIVVGDRVLTRYGSKKVLATEYQGLRDIIEVKTNIGDIKSTSNHRWLAADNNRNKKFIMTGKLSKKNKVYFHPSPINGFIDKDLDYCYMLGFYMGNGCSYSSNRTHEITFQFANKWVTDEQIRIVSDSMRKLGTNPVLRSGHGECIELRCRSKKLVEYFHEFKKPNGPPVLPNDIYDWNINSRASFIAGWMDSDGSYTDDSWKLANTHESTRKDIKKLFLSLGFITTESGIEVRINSYQRSMYMDIIGTFLHKKPTVKIHHETSEIPIHIIDVKKLDLKEHTYDIQVEGVEEFIADGFVSHNSALWGGLNWDHDDIEEFIFAKDWDENTIKLKSKDFNFPASLDMTNISVCYDTKWLEGHDDYIFDKNVYQACKTSEPGFAFNFYDNECDVGRNACAEVTSMFDSDVCNLGSVNMSRIYTIDEYEDVCRLGNMFLVCGTLEAELPFTKVEYVREMSRKIGLGNTGVHEWLIKKNYRYEFNSELHKWMGVYKNSSKYADKFVSNLGITPLSKYRSIAPAGTLSILAGTSSGIEPIYSKGVKRKYLQGDVWTEEIFVDPTVKYIVEEFNIDPDSIETAMDLAKDVERRIKFQYDMQSYVDMGISSTINLPEWGSEYNNEKTVEGTKKIIRKYAHGLRGLTFYADGSRGGQPLEEVPYDYAIKNEGKSTDNQIDFIENSSCKGGSCGI